MSASPPSPLDLSLSSQQQEPQAWQQVHEAIVALGQPAARSQLQLLHRLLERFVSENDSPANSPHLRATSPDSLDSLAVLLARPDVAAASPAARLLALRALKILARCADVRLRCTQHVLNSLAPLLDTPVAGEGVDSAAVALASEAANAASNLCYEPANCTGLVKAGGVPLLLRLLSLQASSSEAQASAAGALQTLSFQPDARMALLAMGGPASLLQALASAGHSGSNRTSHGSEVKEGEAEARLQQRVAGALHNLSSSAAGIAAIRSEGGIPALVSLLGCRHPGAAAAAAGALQNLSREEQAGAEIRAQPEALPGLGKLLTGADMQAAVCAAGTLANLAGHSSSSSMQAMTQALAGALAGGAIYHQLVGRIEVSASGST